MANDVSSVVKEKYLLVALILVFHLQRRIVFVNIKCQFELNHFICEMKWVPY